MYDSKRRFCSYWHQIQEVLRCNPQHALEVGVGNGFTSRYLRERGVAITTCDIDKEKRPDVVASVALLPFPEDAFDTVIACEVLEHLSYEESLKALSELRRVSSRWVIISLPDATPVACFQFPIPFIKKMKLLWSVPHLFPPRHRLTKHGHHWEIGKKDYSLTRIVSDIKKAGFSIEHTYRVFENPYHRFFILGKKAAAR